MVAIHVQYYLDNILSLCYGQNVTLYMHYVDNNYIFLCLDDIMLN